MEQARPIHHTQPPDDPEQAIESGEPLLTGQHGEPLIPPSAEEPLKKHGDKLDPDFEHLESGRHGASA